MGRSRWLPRATRWRNHRSPEHRFYTLAGKFDIENIGVSPNVEDDPNLVAHGYHPQLERAVAIIMQELKKSSVSILCTPLPSYHKHHELGR
ncbi:hypothetical protein [Granulicella arctica]|uniref:hypothetical protein n=1 Tax=Granulicella arctica TaxID=940613 RepID=UPI0021DFEF11|nr:hypothetical protein [Granulicella arctica]